MSAESSGKKKVENKIFIKQGCKGRGGDLVGPA